MEIEPAKRPSTLEKEKERFRRGAADLSLENRMNRELTSGDLQA